MGTIFSQIRLAGQPLSVGFFTPARYELQDIEMDRATWEQPTADFITLSCFWIYVFIIILVFSELPVF